MPVIPGRRIAAAVTRPPWFAVYLVPAGFVVVPVWELSGGDRAWTPGIALVGVLLAVRLGAAVLRRAIPAPRAVQDAWREVRAVAKRHDSYQWQKLAWVGLGLLLHASLGASDPNGPIVLAATCLVLGLAGTIRWRTRRIAGRGGEGHLDA